MLHILPEAVFTFTHVHTQLKLTFGHLPPEWLQAAFKSADVVPSDTTKVLKKTLESAIKQAYGVDAIIHCSRDGKLTEAGVNVL